MSSSQRRARPGRDTPIFYSFRLNLADYVNYVMVMLAFVPYGPGQYTPTPEMENGSKGQEEIEPQRENGGMET